MFFKGIFFCRFETVAERDKVVENIRRLFLKIQHEKVWSAEDLPLDVRTPEHFLFALKKLMASEGWGYTREKIWVDKTKKTLSYGKELVIGIRMEGLDMKLNFGALWEDHLSGDGEFKQVLKEALDKLLERPSTGDGKGTEGGKAGKLPVLPA